MCCLPFFAFLPFRVRNPPDHFPFVTLALIAINMIVFLFTIDWTPGSSHFMSVTPDAIRLLAVSHRNMNPIRLLTAMFLHEGWDHILGNMWFLWLFGPSVEGRLRPLKFTAMYLLAGMVGGLLEDVIVGFVDPTMPSLGASGAIMGLAGAYLYTFPYATFQVGWFSWFLFSFFPRFGVWEWHARWIVIYFLAENLIGAMHSAVMAGMGVAGGVGYLCHLGGMATGFLFCALVKVRRDSEEIAAAQAIRADARDVDLLSVYELEALLQHPTEDMRMVIAFCEKSLTAPGGLGDQRCLWAIQTYGKPLIETADQHRLAAILLTLHVETARMIPTIYYLRLGSNLEHATNYDAAVRIYRRLWEIAPQNPDAEVALSRLGRLMVRVYRNSDHARFYYSEQLRYHPQGRLSEETRNALAMLPYSDTSFR